MKIIEPSVELWLQEDAKAHVARCARVCYGRESGNDDATIKRLINDKHWSMFRHESVYAIISADKVLSLWHDVMSHYVHCPYIDWIRFNDNFYIATNGNFLLDIKESNPVLYEWIMDYKVDAITFSNVHPLVSNLMRYTFKIVTQISTSRELNRVSPNNIAERSTRYVYEDGTICRPHWLEKDKIDVVNNKYNKINLNLDKIDVNEFNKYAKEYYYIRSCNISFANYKLLINDCDMHRQDARGVLPIDTATECVYTYSYKEWLEILKKRLYHTTGKAHPNCVVICQMIENELKELGYEFK